MARPDDIPEDVWDEAWGAEAWARPLYGPTVAEAEKTKVVEAIARTIVDERERCAEIADANAHADCPVAEQIAAAIRKGGQ